MTASKSRYGPRLRSEFHGGNVDLQVDDVGKKRNFYADMLNFEVTGELGIVVFLATGGFYHHIGMNVFTLRALALGKPLNA